MEPVEGRLLQYTWRYADEDPATLAAITKRVAETGRLKTLITYTDLVRGIDVCVPTVNRGRPFRLGVPEWTDLHRAIIGDFLGRLCVDTYREGGFMGSALVVSRDTKQPSHGYRDLMRRLGVLTGTSEDEFLIHWSSETNKAYDWYATRE